jgi:hypothetical protein
MSTTQQDKPGGKPRQRGRKPDARGQKPEQQSPTLDRRDEDQVDPIIASSEVAQSEIGSSEVTSTEVASTDVAANSAAAPAHHHPVGIQAIANAYGDYTRRSLQQSHSFVEKLMGVRSLDKAIEVQTEFAKQSYENFVAESQKIYKLYGELAKQVLEPWHFAARITEAGLASWPAASQSRH